MRNKGILMVLCAAAFWGLSGIAAQLFFEHFQSTPGQLVAIRLLAAGFLMIALQCVLKGTKAAFSIWTDSKDRITLLLFGLLGMLGVQYTFFAAIHYGNAATATLLQYLGPVFIIVFVSLRLRKLPGVKELTAFLLALAGIFFMTTGGSFQALTITPEALVWGLLSAIASAFYTLYPRKLLAEWGAIPVVGWSMIIGGIGLSLFQPPWLFDWKQGSLLMYSLLLYIVIFGTIIPFYLFLDSLRFVTAARASILSSAEPLTAVFVGIAFLHTPMGLIQLLGSLCIIAAVIVLTFQPASRSGSESAESHNQAL